MVKITGLGQEPPQISETMRGTTAATAPGETPSMGQVAAGEIVAISPQAEAAAALLRGIAATDEAEDDPEVARLSAELADGSYHPEAGKIASALLSFERLVARKLGRD